MLLKVERSFVNSLHYFIYSLNCLNRLKHSAFIRSVFSVTHNYERVMIES